MRTLRPTSRLVLCLLVAGCANAIAASQHPFGGDLRQLVLKGRQLPRGFVSDGPAITQDLYDESSPHGEPWLYKGNVRQGQTVRAAFSEFRSDHGKLTLDSEAYSAPNLTAAQAMLRAAPQVVGHSANGVQARRRVQRARLGAGGLLLNGPGLNGEGATAVLWRDGLLVGMVAVDGGQSRLRDELVLSLARKQESILRHALDRGTPAPAHQPHRPSTPLQTAFAWFKATNRKDMQKALSYMAPDARYMLSSTRTSDWPTYRKLRCHMDADRTRTRASVTCTFHASGGQPGNPVAWYGIDLRRSKRGKWLIENYGQP